LHEALRAGNLELALWIIKIAHKMLGTNLIDIVDNDGMRAIDLLAFKVDDDHKKFIK
jgi:hypothetical protein